LEAADSATEVDPATDPLVPVALAEAQKLESISGESYTFDPAASPAASNTDIFAAKLSPGLGLHRSQLTRTPTSSAPRHRQGDVRLVAAHERGKPMAIAIEGELPRKSAGQVFKEIQRQNFVDAEAPQLINKRIRRLFREIRHAPSFGKKTLPPSRPQSVGSCSAKRPCQAGDLEFLLRPVSASWLENGWRPV
jgi:hypothetical protein